MSNAPEGLAPGRVVHFNPPPELAARLGLRDGEVIAGRVSRIQDEEAGLVTVHLDVPTLQDVRWIGSSEFPSLPAGGRPPFTHVYLSGLQAVVSYCAYDPTGSEIGTWRYPPRVK